MPRQLDWIKDSLREQSEKRLLWLITIGFILLQIFIWSVLFRSLWYADRTITDIPVYYSYASRIAQGLMPYRDFSSEYPPLAMALFSLPRLLSGAGESEFVAWFQVEMLLFSCGIVLLLSWISWSQWQNVWKVAGTLAMYTLFLLSLGSIVQERFDLAAAFLMLASVACFITDRYLAAWLLLGIGLMTKVVPVLIAPIFLIAHYRRRQFNEVWMGPVAMIMAALTVSIPFLLASPEGLANAFLYHVERPLQIESTWSSPILLYSKLTGYPAYIMNSYGSHNVYSTVSDTLVMISGPLTAVALLTGYWIFWRRSRKDGNGLPDISGNTIIRFVAIAIVTFIVGGKVLSPQFLIWLIPLVPLVIGADRIALAGIFEAVLLFTQFEFPYSYWQLYTLQPYMVATVAVRNLLLIVLLVMLVAALGSHYRAPSFVNRPGGDIRFPGSGRKFLPFDSN
ncbi:MAG: glycosyltransferase 87 family protein [Thermoleophilia bacterium]